MPGKFLIKHLPKLRPDRVYFHPIHRHKPSLVLVTSQRENPPTVLVMVLETQTSPAVAQIPKSNKLIVCMPPTPDSQLPAVEQHHYFKLLQLWYNDAHVGSLKGWQLISQMRG